MIIFTFISPSTKTDLTPMLLSWLPNKIFTYNLEMCKQVDPRDQSKLKLPIFNCSILKDGIFRGGILFLLYWKFSFLEPSSTNCWFASLNLCLESRLIFLIPNLTFTFEILPRQTLKYVAQILTGMHRQTERLTL